MPCAPYTACVLSEGDHAKVVGRIVRCLVHRRRGVPEHGRKWPRDRESKRHAARSVWAAAARLRRPARVRAAPTRCLSPTSQCSTAGRIPGSAVRSAPGDVSPAARLPFRYARARLSAPAPSAYARRSARRRCTPVARCSRRPRRSWRCDGRSGPRRVPVRERLRVRLGALQHAVRQMRVPVRRRQCRLHPRRRVLGRILHPQAARHLKPRGRLAGYGRVVGLARDGPFRRRGPSRLSRS